VSYQRDPDAYTRGVGAVQAVDKVLAKRRFANPRARAAAMESARRDQLRAKLLRPALGAINTAGFSPANRTVLLPRNIDMPPPTNIPGAGGGGATGGVIQWGASPVAGGGVSATNSSKVLAAVSPVSLTQTAGQQLLQAPSGTIAPGRPFIPISPTPVSPITPVTPVVPIIPVTPVSPVTTFGTNGGNATTASTTSSVTASDGTVIPTSSVGVSAGTPTDPTASSGAPLVPIDTTGIDVSNLDAVAPAAPNYMQYLPYAAAGIALYFILRSRKGS
jgi:hypothetical protein